MKLYTRRGDDGQTDLFGGQRVRKDHLRVEAYGTVDELNSVLGVVLAADSDPRLGEMIREIQARLFEIGADLATPRLDEQGQPRPEPPGLPRIDQPRIDELEHWIDELSEPLPPMRSFILPGGTPVAAHLHLARTVCRRAERLCVSLLDEAGEYQPVTVYLNRLSDLLFAMARRANQLADVEDVPWLGLPR